MQGKLGQLHIDLPGLRLGQDGDGVAARDLAQGEDALEAIDPLAFEFDCSTKPFSVVAGVQLHPQLMSARITLRRSWARASSF